MAEATLTNALVNGGTAVKLNAYRIRYGWKNLGKIEPIAGKYDIAEGNFLGFENPVIEVEGIIDVDNLPSPNTGSNAVITQEYLIDFCLAKEADTYFSVKTGQNNVALKGRPSSGYSVGGTMTDTVKVMIESFDLSFSARESREGYIWRYRLVMREVI